MTKVLFSEMSLTESVERAVSLMGFDCATPIQSEAIPVIRSGADIIARSQTGTGKTVAFAIPAIEKIDTEQEKSTIQVLILCPTRELAVQAYEEIRKLIRFKDGIRPVAVYGGASIEKQCIDLRRANIVIGTPGRVMDHMRRKTIKLDHLKMIVLDEADEMLNMGFKEDIETILTDTPDTRQTLLFSATMPPAIMKITHQFQKNPTLIEIDKGQVTLESIEQRYVDVPHGMKQDALARLMQYYKPNCAIIFCATKKMADELTGFLNARSISSACIHSDIKQAQRTSTMHAFKAGKIKILIATDIAARGIDVSDVEYVINYDIPPNTEYYIHRIGRTGRAGKKGCSITICGYKNEVRVIRRIAIAVKSEIRELALPSLADIQLAGTVEAVAEMETHLSDEINPIFTNIVSELTEKDFSLQQIAEVALSLHYKKIVQPEQTTASRQEFNKPSRIELRQKEGFKKNTSQQAKFYEKATILLDVGESSRISVKHIVGAITERAGISSKDIGKVEVFSDQSILDVSSDCVEDVLAAMKGGKICGKPVNCSLFAESTRKGNRSAGGANKSYGNQGGRKNPRIGKPVKNRAKW